MALDKDKILADIEALAKPELEAQADKIRAMFMKNVDEFIDSSKAHVLDDLVKKAAGYEVEWRRTRTRPTNMRRLPVTSSSRSRPF
jgi:hypothetical protein